jgi:Mlc titration factor MtfA (ptsG expression regulator)/Flp pilus assembly protein TadD
MVFSYFKHARRRKLLAAPFPPAWLEVLARNVGHYALLPLSEQSRLRDKLRILVAELRWEGCKGLVVTDEMKVTVAAQASLLLLGDDDYYFDRVPSLLLYPGAFVRANRAGGRSTVEEETELLGEAWNRGSVILSWPSALQGGRNPRDGHNLVLHELAHHLDGLDGEMGGSPPMSNERLQRWNKVVRAAMEQLSEEEAQDQPELIDPYGLTNQAEFFAVSTESFFERPVEMRSRYAPLYDCLRDLYRVDPAVWFSAKAIASNDISSKEAAIRFEGESASKYLAHAADRHHGLRTTSLLGSSMSEAAGDNYSSSQTLLDDPHLPPLETPDRYFTRGLESFDDGLFDRAERDFDSAVRLRPDDQEALVYRALSRLYLGHDEAALADADRACRLDSSDHEAQRVRGMCRVAMAKFEMGLDDLNTAARVDDLPTDALFFRGVAYAELQQWRKAVDDFTHIIQLDPQDAEAYFERSRCLEMLGDMMAAERDLETAQKLERASPAQSR